MKKVQVSKISVHQSAKVVAVMLSIVIALFTIPIGLFHLVVNRDLSGVSLIFAPLLYLMFMYFFQAIYFWFYNLIAGWVGGIEFVLEESGEE
jgi:hypothetical protein